MSAFEEPEKQVKYFAEQKQMEMTIRYDHANEERYEEAIEALLHRASWVVQMRRRHLD